VDKGKSLIFDCPPLFYTSPINNGCDEIEYKSKYYKIVDENGLECKKNSPRLKPFCKEIYNHEGHVCHRDHFLKEVTKPDKY